MLAIDLFVLQNKQTKQEIGEAVDISFMVLGVYELRAATTLISRVIAVADISSASMGLINSSFSENLPDGIKEAWQTIDNIT